MALRQSLAAAAIAAVLSGCGGGGSGQKAQAPDASAPPPPADAVETILQQRMAAAASPIVTSFGGDVAVCEALGCPVIGAIHIDASTQGLRVPDLSGFERAPSRRGIDRARRSYTQGPLNDPRSHHSFGAWTDHGFFIVESSSEPQGGDFTYRTYWMGDASHTAPLSTAGGSASWSGIMTGVTDGTSDERGAFVHGDAVLTMPDLGASDGASVSVAFTNIAREDGGAPLRDMMWEGLRLQGRSFGTADVRFHEADRGYRRRASFGAEAEGSLFGHIYGLNAEEVGGLFRRGNISGAFAAKRDN